jgi:predicted DNA-binding mobile mystery protein A
MATMEHLDKKLIRDQLNRKLKLFRPLLELRAPSTGWIRAIRESLGMTLKELGHRVGLDKSRLSRIEKAETTGEIKISTLEKVAEGLGMRFVYGFASEDDLEVMVRQQAEKIARERLKRVGHSMDLEDQGLVKEEQEKALENLIERIIIEQPKNFWDR